MRRTLIALAGALALLAGCATTPDTIIHKPAAGTVTPQQRAATAANGSIYQANSYRPIFEDRRARHVGDNLTIVINEKTSAAKAGSGSNSRSGSVSYSAPNLFGINGYIPEKLAAGVAVTGSNKFEDKGAASSSNNFTGTIGVTVIEVMPNGNLLVSGEKQVAFDRGAEFIRFSGIVNPDNIALGNVVSSTLVADARVEYRTNSRLDAADIMSQMTRFFLSVMPL